ncbi:hypothetical protein REPUB_Repub02eG0224300 [Reevesia pubescens]
MVPVDPLEWQISHYATNSFVACLANIVGAAESVLKVAAMGHEKRLFFRVTVVRSEKGGRRVATVVLRESTDSILDDLERAIKDGVNAYKYFLLVFGYKFQGNYHDQIHNAHVFFSQAMCMDSHIVPGAAATEMELARRLKEFSFKETR